MTEPPPQPGGGFRLTRCLPPRPALPSVERAVCQLANQLAGRGGRLDAEFLAEQRLKLAVLAQHSGPVTQLRHIAHHRAVRGFLQRVGLQPLARKAQRAIEITAFDAVLLKGTQGAAESFAQAFLFW